APRARFIEKLEDLLLHLVAGMLPGEFGPGRALDFGTLDEVEKVRVFVEVGDARGDQGLQPGTRLAGAFHLGHQALQELLRRAGQERQVQLFLVAEVAVERPLADLGLASDVVHAHLVKALGAKQAAGRVEDLLRLQGGFGTHEKPWDRGRKWDRTAGLIPVLTGQFDYKALAAAEARSKLIGVRRFITALV